jgi:hypothetical protein
MDTSIGCQNCAKYSKCQVDNQASVCCLAVFMPQCQAGILHEESQGTCCPSMFDGCFYCCCQHGPILWAMAIAQAANNGKMTCEICCFACLPCFTCSTCEIARLNDERRGGSKTLGSLMTPF